MLSYKNYFYVEGSNIRAYNRMNPNYEKYLFNGDFTNYMCVGTGKNENKDEFEIQHLICKYISNIVMYNFDPCSGELFIEKSIVLPRAIQADISEIGFCGKNGVLANYATFEKPIKKTNEKEMVLKGRIYLSYTGEVSFAGGENKLVKFLLGDYYEPIDIKTSSSIMVGYSTIGNIPCNVEADDMKLASIKQITTDKKLEIVAEVKNGNEVVVFFDYKPALRYCYMKKQTQYFNVGGVILTKNEYLDFGHMSYDFEFYNIPKKLYKNYYKLFYIAPNSILKTDDCHKCAIVIDNDKIRVFETAPNRRTIQTQTILINNDYDIVQLAGDKSVFCFSKAKKKLFCFLNSKNKYLERTFEFDCDDFCVTNENKLYYHLLSKEGDSIILYRMDIEEDQFIEIDRFSFGRKDFSIGVYQRKFFAYSDDGEISKIFVSCLSSTEHENNLKKILKSNKFVSFDGFYVEIVDENGQQKAYDLYKDFEFTIPQSQSFMKSGFAKLCINKDSQGILYEIRIQTPSIGEVSLRYFRMDLNIVSFIYIENAFIFLMSDGSLYMWPVIYNISTFISVVGICQSLGAISYEGFEKLTEVKFCIE